MPKTNTQKKIKHRHKWEQEYADCPQCGLGEYFICDCGEVRLSLPKKLTPNKK